MRIILDENIPLPLGEWLASHGVTSVQQAGWSGISNGELLEKVDGIFDLFVTADKNLRYQQNLQSRRIAILELPTNRLRDLLPLRSRIEQEIASMKPRDYRILSA
jgi:hypothetical protein